MNSFCTMPWESKKIINLLLMWDLWNSFGRGNVLPTHSEHSVALFRVKGETPGLFYRNNVVKKCLSVSAFAIISWQDVTRFSLCSGIKECGTKCAHNFLPPNSLSESDKLQSCRCSKILLSFLMRFEGHFWPNQQQQHSLPQFASILDSQLSRHLPAHFRLEIEYSI